MGFLFLSPIIYVSPVFIKDAWENDKTPYGMRLSSFIFLELTIVLVVFISIFHLANDSINLLTALFLTVNFLPYTPLAVGAFLLRMNRKVSQAYVLSLSRWMVFWACIVQVLFIFISVPLYYF
jgi:hypothetical protein